MNRPVSQWWAVALATASLALGSAALAQPAFKQPARYHPTDQERAEIEAGIASLAKALEAPRVDDDDLLRRDTLADVAVYHKAAVWALRLGEFYDQKDVAATLKVLAHGLERAGQRADGREPWEERRGSVVRGYHSRVDGSVQPYAVVVPADVDPNGRRTRLDVVLHGRGATLNEGRFIQQYDGKPAPEDARGTILLHVFGRTNNAYRWAGETDVFEAIEAVKRHYPIDDQRVVLRGFSMGGAGAWHLGLHYPSLWAAVEAGAGFNETKSFARLSRLPDEQEKTLHIYDAVDYASNALNVPIAAYGGENDPQRQASLNVEEALKGLGYRMKVEGLVTRGEGIDFLRVVGAGMGHAVDPASAAILRAFRDEHAARGVDLNPRRIRFVTYTTKYNTAPWLTVEQLQEHYRRALVDAEVQDKVVVVREVENVAVLAIERHIGESIRLGGQVFPLEGAVKGLLPYVYFRRSGDQWEQLDYEASRKIQENVDRGKRRNLQGPIDDAFTGSFLCVRGTGTPWSPAAQRWADARLERFADDWRRWMRGEVRIKSDTEVTAEDIEDHHLVLFGDPGSNAVLARVLEGLPIGWTRDEVKLGGRYASADHAPVLIAPNPLNRYRYVVVNSGQTFGAPEFTGTNALLFPRLGDYAVFHVDAEGEMLKASGFFDESWKLKPGDPS